MPFLDKFLCPDRQAYIGIFSPYSIRDENCPAENYNTEIETNQNVNASHPEVFSRNMADKGIFHQSHNAHPHKEQQK
jgi:hypothetical protein